MTASEIVRMALDEAIQGANGGDDEIVTIERIFHVDRKLQKELGTEEGGEQGRENQEANAAEAQKEQQAISAQDEDIDYVTLFTKHMAEDAAPQTDFTKKPDITPAQKRHDTPLSQCRAKDPLYCRYHGDKAMHARLEEAFKKAGVELKGMSVTKETHGDFRIKVSVPKKQAKDAGEVLNGIGNWPGFKEVTAENFRKTEEQIERQDLHMVAKSAYENDPQVKLDEYVDSAVKDFANSDDIPTEDFVAMLNAKKKADDSYEAWQASPEDETAYDAYKKDRSACEDIYHKCAAMVTMKDIKDYEQASSLWNMLQKAKAAADETGSYEVLRDKVNNVKAKYGIKQFRGATLNDLDGVDEWKHVSQALSFAFKDRAKYLLGYQEGVDEAAGTIKDLAKVRWALHGLKFSTESYVRAIADAVNVASRVEKSVEEYAKQNGIQPLA